jgi:hypothetical protein
MTDREHPHASPVYAAVERLDAICKVAWNTAGKVCEDCAGDAAVALTARHVEELEQAIADFDRHAGAEDYVESFDTLADVCERLAPYAQPPLLTRLERAAAAVDCMRARWEAEPVPVKDPHDAAATLVIQAAVRAARAIVPAVLPNGGDAMGKLQGRVRRDIVRLIVSSAAAP